MKPADAQNPKFDAAWWNQNKSKAADVSGDFGRALQQYTAARATLLNVQKCRGIDETKKALEAIVKQAKKTDDVKLGPQQADTKAALKRYAELSEQAIKRILPFAGAAAAVQMSAEKLLTANNPGFLAYCEQAHEKNNLLFVRAMRMHPTGSRAIFEEFVRPGAKHLINIDGALRKGVSELAKNPDDQGDAARKTWKGLAADATLTFGGQNFAGEQGTVYNFKTWTVKQIGDRLPS